MAKLKLEKAGILTTIQDLGRPAYAALGVPLSGPMDKNSFLLANHLMRKSPADACLEIYMGDLEMVFDSLCQLVVTGASCKICCENKSYHTNELIEVPKGKKLTLSRFRNGQWAYLAINGSFLSQTVMGSQSFYPGITRKSRFSAGEEVLYQASQKNIPPLHAKVKPSILTYSPVLPAFKGPSFSLLSPNQQAKLNTGIFTLSTEQNRMGIHLVEEITHSLKEVITTPVYPGTVQLTSSGKLIVLMLDAQVTGGYHRVLQLPQQSIGTLAQLRPGENFRFQLIDIPK
ncbi:biotin-dependent carboxyltransferase family protein [Cyclobacterium jeungdonense]|uniref:Biotin-dependent carboxyltransferase family protein n=1 Tax=Cyclobacterium jeungdonense TaxID=708087 RepID=A0ABT8CDZ0_9BACT|nr:biotin-dependent carboxyltransferase family protein [Cyclobacterium jeungdonense]MDN3690282.1 biotin-dependent carboxyltransferase family protein [Cyclobacterium jeungdonense]